MAGDEIKLISFPDPDQSDQNDLKKRISVLETELIALQKRLKNLEDATRHVRKPKTLGFG